MAPPSNFAVSLEASIAFLEAGAALCFSFAALAFFSAFDHRHEAAHSRHSSRALRLRRRQGVDAVRGPAGKSDDLEIRAARRGIRVLTISFAWLCLQGAKLLQAFYFEEGAGEPCWLAV